MQYSQYCQQKAAQVLGASRLYVAGTAPCTTALLRLPGPIDCMYKAAVQHWYFFLSSNKSAEYPADSRMYLWLVIDCTGHLNTHLDPMRICQMCFGFFSAALPLCGQLCVSARHALVWEVTGCRVWCHRPQRDQVLHGERMSVEWLLGTHARFGGGRPLAVTSFALISHHPLGKEMQWESWQAQDTVMSPRYLRLVLVHICPFAEQWGFQSY